MAAERRPSPRSGRTRKQLKMTALHARQGPARPVVARWLASFLVDWLLP